MTRTLLLTALLGCTSAADADKETGETGETSHSGDTGDTGETSHSGETADTGETSHSGETSDTGETSHTDDTDDTEDTADSGETSHTGDTADSGETSHTGDTADSADTADSGDTADSADTAESSDTGDSDPPSYVDEDRDGATTRIDCDDTRADVFPGAPEVCNGVDDDCDGAVDDEDEDVEDPSPWYGDADADGFGDAADLRWACEAPDGYVDDDTDCAPDEGGVYPGADEVCDGEDSDCDAASDACDGACAEADPEGGPDCDGACDLADTTWDCDGACGAEDAAGGPDCDDACAPGDAGTDCDGACDLADQEGSSDCDATCDLGDAGEGPDCASLVPDGSCGWQDGTGSPDCDGPCDAADGAGSPDCDAACDAGESGPDCPAADPLPTGVDLWLYGVDDAGYAGHGVAGVGDLDEDGFDDIALGVPNAAPDGLTAAGRLLVVYGGEGIDAVTLEEVASGVGGYPIDGDIGAWDVELVLCRGNVPSCEETTTVGVGAFDGWSRGPAGPGFGFAVAPGGDVDGDGVPDLLVSSPFGRPDARLYAGVVYAISGATAGAGTSLASLEDGAGGGFAVFGSGRADQWASSVEEGDGDLTGFTLVGGLDLDGDGLTDLVAGAPNADAEDEGWIVVARGTGDPSPVDVGALDDEPDRGWLVSGYTAPYALVPSRFGWVLGGGDFDGDGRGDLAVQPQPFGGEFGTLVLPAADVASVDEGQRIAHGSFSFSCYLDTACDLTGRFLEGYAVGAGGDVDGDGYGDLVLRGTAEGAPADAWVVHGRDDLDGVDLDALDATTPEAWEIGGDMGASDPWPDGAAIVADLDGDGLDEVVVTAPLDDPGGVDEAGRAWIALGREARTSLSLDDLAAGTGGFAIGGEAAGERLGFSVAGAGDVNGDGFADLLLGAPWYQSGGTGPQGRVGVVFGGDWSGGLTGRGGAGDDAFVGTAAAERYVTGRGDDAVDGGGGADVVYLGPGDDTVLLRDLAARRIDLGTGTDQVTLRGLGAADAEDWRGTLRGYEVLTLDTGTTSVSLHALDVANASPTSNVLAVLGASGTVAAADGDWAWEGLDTWDGEPVDRYGEGELVVLVAASLDVDFPPAVDDAAWTVAEDAALRLPLGTLTASDPDGAVASWRLVDDGDGHFAIDDGTIVVAAPLDHEAAPTWTLLAEVTDDGGRTATATVEVTVTDVNEAPVFDAEAWVYSVDEGSASGTEVGVVHADDEDEGDAVSYTLSLEGGSDSGPFALDEGRIVVEDPTDLDFEYATTWDLVVTATDTAGAAATASVRVEVGDVDTFRTDLSLGFSTSDRSIWDDDGSVPFDFDVVSGTASIPAGDPTVSDVPYPGGSAEVSFDFGGDFDTTIAADVDLGSLSASLPIDVQLSIPDVLAEGVPFAIESTWSLGEGASFWGALPSFEFSLSLQARNVTAEGQVCWTDASCDTFVTDTYSMDEPAELVYETEGAAFSGAPTAATVLETDGSVTSPLLEAEVAWEDTLYTTLYSLGLPSLRGEFSYGSLGDAASAEVEYLTWWSEIQAYVDLTSAFTLEVTGVQAELELEDGSTRTFDLGEPATLTLSASADTDGDGRVRYVLSLSPVVSVVHEGAVRTEGAEQWWAGSFDAQIYTFGDLFRESSYGPMYDARLSLSSTQDFTRTFTLGGFSTATVRGAFTLD